jgi:cell division protein FtsQ
VPWRVLGRVVPLVLVAFTIAAVVHRVLPSSEFRVQRVTVRGNERLAPGEVLALLDGIEGEHLLDVDLQRWRQRLMGSPWVADVRLHKRLPGTIDVDIVERVPLAVARRDGQLFLIDEDGAVIDEYGPLYADIDLPIVDGWSHGEDAEARNRTALAARVLDALSSRRDLLARLSQIDVRDVRDAVVILGDEGTRIHLGDSGFAERLDAYVELAPALRARVPEMDSVDLRFGSRIFVRPAGGRAPWRTTGGDGTSLPAAR